VVLVPMPGGPGPQGDPGIQGPPGPTGPINNGYQHVQSAAAATWIVSHTLGRYPLSHEIVINGEVVNADVTYSNAFTVVVAFATPQAGTLRLT
jgi:hypothetical protein